MWNIFEKVVIRIRFCIFSWGKAIELYYFVSSQFCLFWGNSRGSVGRRKY